MNIIKTRLWNKKEDEFLGDNMIVYIEKDITANFSFYSIIDEFQNPKEWMAILEICVISFIVIVILNYVFIFIVLVTVINI